MRTLLTTLTLLFALLLAPTPSTGTDDTDLPVAITVDAPPKLLSTHTPFSWSLSLPWAEAEVLGADAPATALDLLAHIVATEGSTYRVDWVDLDGDGTAESAFVDEINGVATDFSLFFVGYFWALYTDGESATTSINTIPLAPGAHIHLEYTGWPLDA